MTKRALLVLENGTIFEGYNFGAAGESYGEVVFTTCMTGYQEILTDPSFAGQIVVLTYPLQGNYGINLEDIESRRIQVRGMVVREECPTPSHYRSMATLHEYLQKHGVVGIAGVDTRALTRQIRTRGVMMGILTTERSPQEALARLREAPRYDLVNYVEEVTAPAPYPWTSEVIRPGQPVRVVVLDMGVKYNILRILRALGAEVEAVPCYTSAEDILARQPHGVVLSPGPGDPALLDSILETVKGLLGRIPVMGICLGHQLIGRALGAPTFKLKFGHRGGNHPVKDLTTGRVHITAQNHGYAVDGDRLRGGAEVSHINLNDGTVEGLRHRELPLISIQYHSEASPGPWDNVYLFERFLEMVRQSA